MEEIAQAELNRNPAGSHDRNTVVINPSYTESICVVFCWRSDWMSVGWDLHFGLPLNIVLIGLNVFGVSRKDEL